MPTWILDDGPFGLLAKFVRVEDLQSWPQDQLFVAEQTALDARPDAARNALLAADSSPFQSFTVMMDTQAAQILFEHLRPTAGRATANLAEHQSIAWAICERQDAIFVVLDRKATSLALAELGCGRVAHAYDLWLYLLAERYIDQMQFENLCRATCNTDQSSIPVRCQR